MLGKIVQGLEARSIREQALIYSRYYFPSPSNYFLKIRDFFYRYISKLDKTKVFALIVLKNGNILYGYYPVDSYGMIHEKFLQKSFDVENSYWINNFPTVFLYEDIRASIDIKKFSALFVEGKPLSVNPKVAFNKMNNNSISLAINAISRRDLEHYAIFIGAIAAVVTVLVLFDLIHSPILMKILDYVTPVIDHVTPVIDPRG